MAFLLRRPFAITATATATLRQAVPKPSQTITFRAFHSTPLKQARLSPSQHITKFRQSFRRSYQQAAYNPVAQGDLRQRLLYGAGIFGVT
jgi:hypothetical protein